MTTIRPATTADHAEATAALASAFAYDPLFAWIAGAGPDESIETKVRPMFGAIGKLVLSNANHLAFVTEDGAGAAIWQHPNEWKMSNTDVLRVLPAMVRSFGLRTPRMIRGLNAVEKVHPKEEHYYLEAIGTRRDMQGKGIGSALIRPMLERCDAEGMPAYLESSNPQNVPFYARHGFEATGEIALGKGAPPVTAMWRAPR